MRFIFLSFIKLYWLIKPKQINGRCLFKESCSNFVYNTAKSKGFYAATKAIKYRIKNCKPGYSIHFEDEKIKLITVQKNIIEEEFISEAIINNTIKKNHYA